MEFVDRVNEFLVGSVTFPFVNYLLNRRNILGTYRSLRKSERHPENVLKELQLTKFKDVLNYANTWCPYYHRKFSESGLAIEDIKTLEDIRIIPPLSRQEVIDHHKDMVDFRFRSSIETAEQSKRGPGAPIPFSRFRRHKLIRNISTGSTGMPTVFYEDGSSTAMNWAHELRLKKWYGFQPGVKEVRLARVSTDYLPASKVLHNRRHLWNQLILPGMNLSDEDYALILAKIEQFEPLVLFGITTALTGLAEFILRVRNRSFLSQPKLIITWAAPLYEHEEKLLKEVFGCPITNIYGTREVGHVASVCPHGSLHINQEHYIVETEGEIKNENEYGAGELLITTLFKSPMPFIRYQVGDVGEVGRSDCPCGRPQKVLKSLLGRTGDVYITERGRMIAPNFWCRAFMVGKPGRSVERFQVIYRKDYSIHFRIVKKDSYSIQTERELRRYFEKSFQKGVQFDFEYVSRIDPQPSGKYQLVINEVAT